MRTVAFALALSVVSMASSAAERAQFQGQVVRDGSVLTDVSLSVAEESGATLKLSDGTTLEFSVAAAADGTLGSVVRLVDARGGVLHSATTPDIASPKSFRYVICGERVTFQSPSGAGTLPACPGGGV